MYYFNEEKEIFPDLKMLERIIDKLSDIFDSQEIYHHSHYNEMFEYQYRSCDRIHESWGIYCMGTCIASGNELAIEDYDECQDENYIKAIAENESKIYNEAYKNTLNLFAGYFSLFIHSDISKEDREKILKEVGWDFKEDLKK